MRVPNQPLGETIFGVLVGAFLKTSHAFNKVLEIGCGAKFKPDEKGPYNCKHNESTDLGSVG